MNEFHKYLCWLDQIPEIGRKGRFSLLQAAASRNLFSGEQKPGSSFAAGESGPGSTFVSVGPDPGNSFVFGEPGTTSTFVSVEPGTGSSFVSVEPDPGASLAFGARVLYEATGRQLTWLCGEAFSSRDKAQKAVQLLTCAKTREPSRVEEELFRADIRFSCILEEDFPWRLRRIPDPPFGIYAKGRLPDADPASTGLHRTAGSLESAAAGARESAAAGARESAAAGARESAAAGVSEPAAAVIGARLASGYGREQARRFGRRLGARGVTVISGMARGIDGIAQRAALDAGGMSFAVLGCGVDICYPEENRDLYERLIQDGGVLSEYAPRMPPEARMFPPRNRIISGLSDLVLVIEARKKSGTLITVDMALEQGREVFALPGRVSDPLSDGCNRLIRQGAGIATCPEDILQFFFGTGEDIRKRREEKNDQKTAEKNSRKPSEEKSAVSGASRGPEEGRAVEESGTGRCTFGEDRPECPEKYSGEEERHRGGQSGGDRGQHCAERAEGQESREIPETDLSAGACGPVHSPAPGEDSGEDEQEEEPASLEALILRLLSSEEETHLERILQDVGKYADEGRLLFDAPDFSAVNACLLALRIDGRVEEPFAGYYRKAARW